MSENMSPLKSFLIRSKKLFETMKCPDNSSATKNLVFVMGNTSCDLDSVTSSIGYAAYQGVEHVPIMNISKKAFPSLLQQQAWFLEKYFDIRKEDLVFWEDIIECVQLQNHKFFLVDHNEVDPSQKEILSKKVIGCLDHHKLDHQKLRDVISPDVVISPEENSTISTISLKQFPFIIHAPPNEKAMAGTCKSNPLVVGSTASIVTEIVISSTPRTPRMIPELTESILQLLQGAIISDTRNFADDTYMVKWSSYDKDMYEAGSRMKESLQRNNLADLLFKIKYDVKRNLDLGIYELLGTDYKFFVYTGSNSTTINVGFSSLSVNLTDFTGVVDDKTLGDDITRFMGDRKIDFLILLSSNVKHEKNLGLASIYNKHNWEAKGPFCGLYATLEKECNLEQFKSLTHSPDDLRIVFTYQKNTKLSRKQVEPIVRGVFTA